MAQGSVDPSGSEDGSRHRPESLDARLGPRYGQIRSLGPSRTLGQAYRARDLRNEREVVLRHLPEGSLTGAAAEALHSQFEAHAASKPDGFFEDVADVHAGAGAVLVRPYAEGEPLAEHLERAPFPLRDALSLVEAIVEDLRAAHDHGVLHGHLDPSNVVVPDANFEEATVVDFGLRPVVGDPESVTDLDQPLARYVSPERAGLVDAKPAPASDLYLVGLIFYHALAGAFPYEGDDFSQLLRSHVTRDPEPIRRVRPQLPRAVDQVLERLLRPDPDQRYQSASGLLADVREIHAGLAAKAGEGPFVVGTEDDRSTLARPGFLDRERELAALEAHVREARSGRGGVVKVEAVSGGGKTRLIEEFTQRGPLGGVRVFRGQVHEAVAVRPFQAIRGVVQSVAARCARDPDRARRLEADLGEHLAAVCEAFPPLAEALGVERAPSLGPEEYGEERTLAALSHFLDAVGTPEEPALVVLDDCQWADELTVRLLRRWSRNPPGDASRHTSVLVAFRSDEVDDRSPLRALSTAVDLHLPLFDDDQVSDLARSMAGPLPDEVVDLVTRLAEGNPFMTTAVLRGLIESGALVHGEEGWVVREDALDVARATEHAAGFLRHRLEHLPSRTQAFLAGAATLGKEFDPNLAAALVDLSDEAAAEVLERAVDRRIVWETDEGGRYTFVHDKLRETLLERLDADRRRAFHLEAAERIEETDPANVYELAYHFHAADESERALPYALPAAERARERYALETAETYYRIAADGVADDDRETRLEIHAGLGETLILAGRYDRARQALEPARDLAQTSRETAQIEGKRGELAFKRGEMSQAVDASERALAALGEHVPTWTVTYALLLVWETLVQVTHSLLPGWTVGRREPDETDLLVVRQYTRLTYASWFTRGALPTLWAHLRELNLSERYPPTPERAQAYATHAPLMTQLPWFGRGERYADRGIEIARELEDPYREGVAHHFRGLVRYGAARYEAALETLREAEHLLERTGDRWEANTAAFHVAFCLYRLGRWDEAVDKARAVHERAQRIGDQSNVGLALEVWAKASDGRVPRELVEEAIEQTPEQDAQTLEAAHQALGVHLLRNETPEAARQAFERAAEIRDRAGLRSEYVAPIPCWRVTALRRQAEQLDERTPHRREELLDRAAKLARKATRIARLYPNNRPHAYRERGLVAACKGHPRWARRWLDKSLEAAREQSATVERARTLQARAELGVELGWARAEDDAARARSILEGTAADEETGEDAPTLSLLERFSALLDRGREIATGLSEEEICASVHEASLDLLRATHCALVRPGEDPGPVTVHGDPELPVDATLVRRAVREDEILAYPREGAQPGLLPQGVASLLVAPVRVHGDASLVLYVSHEEVEGIFGDTERRLASFVTSIGGAALENAHNVEELAELNERLEGKVEERTAELQTRLAQQARIARLGREALALEDDPEQLISRVCRIVRETLDADAATLLQLDPDRDRFRLREAAGWEPPPDEQVVVELEGRSQAGYTLVRDGPVVVGNLPEESRFEPNDLLLEEGVRSSVSVPVPGREGAWGVLGAHVRRREAITEDDANFVQSVANVLGAALQQHRARRKLEERARELAESNDELERALSLQDATLDATADGILVVDLDGNIVSYNEQFQEMWRIPDRVVGERDDEAAMAYVLDQVADPEGFVERVEELYEHPEQESWDVIEFEDGRIFERYSQPQRVGDRIVGRVWSFRDVTDERRVLRELEQANAELERANEDLRQFAYVASHDLQEPIRMVSSYVQLLQDRYGDELDDEADEIIEYAVEGAQRLHELIKGLLTYSRVDRQGSEPESVDLGALVDEVRQSLNRQIQETDAEIRFEDPPVVGADRTQLGQVFQNLLSNAMKFRKEDIPPRVEVEATREDDAWRISVADNGVGLDPERADRLFEIFQRGQGRDAYPGQGVGLAVCKKIVERHGGEIWVDSEPEVGSTFHFTLPDDPPSAASADAIADQSTERTRRGAEA